jgi:glycosyltransferase involved in cell wall biosynthesis
MKLMFAHDSKFLVNQQGDVFSKGNFPYSVWQRYLSVFDELLVVGRKENQILDDTKLSRSSGPNVFFYMLPSLSGAISRIKNYNEVERNITKVMQDSDAVLIRLPSEIGLSALRVAKKINKPFAVEVVGCAWDGLWYFGNWQGKLYAPLHSLLTKQAIKNSECTIYVTEHFLQKRYPSKGTVYSCSNVLLNMNEEVLIKRLNRISEMNEIKKIGLIGNLGSKIKGIDVAIRSLPAVAKSFPQIQLHILGGGNPRKLNELASKLEVSDRVYYHGIKPSGNEVHQWLDEIDIYIQPSKTEGLPRAMIEAMSRGCPCIGASTGGIPELLEEEFLHNRNNGNELAKRIIMLGSDRNALKEQAERNFERVLLYSSEEHHKIRTKFLKNLLNIATNKR